MRHWREIEGARCRGSSTIVHVSLYLFLLVNLVIILCVCLFAWLEIPTSPCKKASVPEYTRSCTDMIGFNTDDDNDHNDHNDTHHNSSITSISNHINKRTTKHVTSLACANTSTAEYWSGATETTRCEISCATDFEKTKQETKELVHDAFPDMLGIIFQQDAAIPQRPHDILISCQ